MEVLEARVALTTFLVVNALDGPGNGPVGSLRYAIAQADMSDNPTDRVVITSHVRGPITLSAGEIAISTSLAIENGAGRAVEIRQTTGVVHVTNDPKASRISIGSATGVSPLMIDGGNVDAGNGGGILVDHPDSVLSLTHVKLVGNSATVATSSVPTQSGGGGVYTSGRLVLDHTTVGTTGAPNQTTGSGGAIWAGKGLTTSAAKIQGNSAGVDGGGVYLSAGGARSPTGRRF